MANVFKSHPKLSWLVALLFIAAGALATLELTNTTHLFGEGPSEGLPTAQSGYNDRAKDEPSRNGTADGGATNTPITSPTTPSNQWTVSESGAVTVYSPVDGAMLSSGSILSGAATEPSVYFRLVDNEVGQIAQGMLDVSNGKFSGKLAFISQGTTGVMKVFTINSDGSEVNLVKINVKF
jgi:hypothetical protein